jgi:hypothetical protein
VLTIDETGLRQVDQVQVVATDGKGPGSAVTFPFIDKIVGVAMLGGLYHEVRHREGFHAVLCSVVLSI